MVERNPNPGQERRFGPAQQVADVVEHMAALHQPAFNIGYERADAITRDIRGRNGLTMPLELADALHCVAGYVADLPSGISGGEIAAFTVGALTGMVNGYGPLVGGGQS